MTKRKTLKAQITEAVLKEIPKHHTEIHNLSVDQLMFKWWMSGRQDGMRLTDAGVAAFGLAEIAFYDYPLKQEGQSWHSFLLEVNKKISCPFYLGISGMKIAGKKGEPYIRFYDSKVAMLMSLYGTLEEYLKSITLKH